MKNNFGPIILGYTIFLMLLFLTIFLILHIKWMKKVKNGGFPGKMPKKYSREIEDKLKMIE